MYEQSKTARPRGTDRAKVIQVIVTESIAGRGEERDPVRRVLQYWSFDGKLLAIRDEWKDHLLSMESASSNVSSDSM